MKQTIYQIILPMTILMMSFFCSNAQVMDTTILFKRSENKKMPSLDSIVLIYKTHKFLDKHGSIIVDADSNILVIRKKYKSGTILSVSNHGFKIGDGIKKKKKKKHKKLHVGMHFDFGFNNIIDNTNYTSGTANQGLVVIDTTVRDLNDNDLNLLNGRSINFNFWPVWLKQDIAKHNVQIETGLGFQFFNYRYSTRVRHTNAVPANPNIPPMLASTLKPGFEDITDPSQLQGKEKNKLGVSYVSVPLMLRFNSNKKNGHRYFIGAGVIGSYKLKSWTKFYGDKSNNDYAINDWMTQVSAELGITGVIKLYGTYALQSMYSNGIDRQPFAIGIRL